MKRFFVIFIVFFCGCSRNVNLNCSSVDNGFIFGSRTVNDVISFNDDKIISFKRGVYFDVNGDVDIDIKDVYKIVKLEGKALKKYIGGRYKIMNSDGIHMIFTSKKFNNLKYIGIDSGYGYDEVLGVYNELGFSCK